jgi:hypothetical protein
MLQPSLREILKKKKKEKRKKKKLLGKRFGGTFTMSV